mmetsp:Transcript_9361/g.23611  ORF Transcript_9361/g.23611 Transcript_9361/m.23611 type:complete len:155 (-) Transcript_9361:1123-1587(-)
MRESRTAPSRNSTGALGALYNNLMGIQDRPATRTLSSPPSVSGGASVSDFDLVKVIGQGSFGKVFLVRPRWTNDATVYAMKVVKKDDVRRRNQMEHTKAERRIMAKITHPFVISLMFAFQSRDKLYVYAVAGSLCTCPVTNTRTHDRHESRSCT